MSMQKPSKDSYQKKRSNGKKSEANCDPRRIFFFGCIKMRSRLQSRFVMFKLLRYCAEQRFATEEDSFECATRVPFCGARGAFFCVSCRSCAPSNEFGASSRLFCGPSSPGACSSAAEASLQTSCPSWFVPTHLCARIITDGGATGAAYVQHKATGDVRDQPEKEGALRRHKLLITL